MAGTVVDDTSGIRLVEAGLGSLPHSPTSWICVRWAEQGTATRAAARRGRHTDKLFFATVLVTDGAGLRSKPPLISQYAPSTRASKTKDQPIVFSSV